MCNVDHMSRARLCWLDCVIASCQASRPHRFPIRYRVVSGTEYAGKDVLCFLYTVSSGRFCPVTGTCSSRTCIPATGSIQLINLKSYGNGSEDNGIGVVNPLLTGRSPDNCVWFDSSRSSSCSVAVLPDWPRAVPGK
jgi:hypothetical protein